jgi:hypothetical protein
VIAHRNIFGEADRLSSPLVESVISKMRGLAKSIWN